MPEKTYAGVSVQVNDEGFFLDHTAWKKEMAAEIAKEEGIEDFGDGHWKVIEFLQKYHAEKIHDAGGKLYACKASVDMFDLKQEDFCDQVEKVLTVGEFYGLAAGGQIIFT